VDAMYFGVHAETPTVMLSHNSIKLSGMQATQAKEMLNKGSTKLLAKATKQE